MGQRDDLAAEKKLWTDGWKERKAEKDFDIAHLSRVVKDNREDRPVECELVPDFERNQVMVMRLDTGEQVDSRTMTLAERQQPLSLVAVVDE